MSPKVSPKIIRTRLVLLVFIPSILWPNCGQAWSVQETRRCEFPAGRRSTEEHGTRSRAVDLRVTCGAVGVLRVLIVLWARRFDSSNIMSNTVAGQAELINRAVAQ